MQCVSSNVFSLQVVFHFFVVCLTSRDNIEKHDAIVFNLYMKTEEGTVIAYPQTINEIVIHQFFTICKFFDILCIDDFLNGFSD